MRVLVVVAALLIACGILTVLYDFEVNHATVFSRFDPASPDKEKPFPAARILLSSGMMVLGIFAGALHSAVQGKSQVASIRKEFLGALKSAHFIKSVLTAPIIFSAVYLATKDQPDWVLASIFAFENGFFCDSVLRSREKQGPS
jgi:hypothetical protein